MTNKSFLAGSEEVIARLASLLITLLFFAIYVSAKDTILVDWYKFTAFLALFWIIYEVISYILFMIFRFFSKAEEKSLPLEPTQIEETKSPFESTKSE